MRDTGVGIAPPMLERIWHLFQQADRSLDRSQGGLGIGLNIVRSLVELHGGTVEATSPGLGQGSTFVVRLPVAPADAVRPHGDDPVRPQGDDPSRTRRAARIRSVSQSASRISSRPCTGPASTLPHGSQITLPPVYCTSGHPASGRLSRGAPGTAGA